MAVIYKPIIKIQSLEVGENGYNYASINFNYNQAQLQRVVVTEPNSDTPKTIEAYSYKFLPYENEIGTSIFSTWKGISTNESNISNKFDDTNNKGNNNYFILSTVVNNQKVGGDYLYRQGDNPANYKYFARLRTFRTDGVANSLQKIYNGIAVNNEQSSWRFKIYFDNAEVGDVIPLQINIDDTPQNNEYVFKVSFDGTTFTEVSTNTYSFNFTVTNVNEPCIVYIAPKPYKPLLLNSIVTAKPMVFTSLETQDFTYGNALMDVDEYKFAPMETYAKVKIPKRNINIENIKDIYLETYNSNSDTPKTRTRMYVPKTNGIVEEDGTSYVITVKDIIGVSSERLFNLGETTITTTKTLKELLDLVLGEGNYVFKNFTDDASEIKINKPILGTKSLNRFLSSVCQLLMANVSIENDKFAFWRL